MAKLISAKITVSPVVLMEFTEEELRALDGIFGYDVERFLKVFYEKMGKSYVQPHENGVRSLHATIRNAIEGPLAALQQARRVLSEANIKLP